jgi:hypothetical protein
MKEGLGGPIRLDFLINGYKHMSSCQVQCALKDGSFEETMDSEREDHFRAELPERKEPDSLGKGSIFQTHSAKIKPTIMISMYFHIYLP